MTAARATLELRWLTLSAKGALAAAPARTPITALRILGVMGTDPKVYASGLHDVEMQNPCEFNEYPGRHNIPNTRRNRWLRQILPADPLRTGNRLTSLFWAVAPVELEITRRLHT